MRATQLPWLVLIVLANVTASLAMAQAQTSITYRFGGEGQVRDTANSESCLSDRTPVEARGIGCIYGHDNTENEVRVFIRSNIPRVPGNSMIVTRSCPISGPCKPGPWSPSSIMDPPPEAPPGSMSSYTYVFPKPAFPEAVDQVCASIISLLPAGIRPAPIDLGCTDVETRISGEIRMELHSSGLRVSGWAIDPIRPEPLSLRIRTVSKGNYMRYLNDMLADLPDATSATRWPFHNTAHGFEWWNVGVEPFISVCLDHGGAYDPSQNFASANEIACWRPPYFMNDVYSNIQDGEQVIQGERVDLFFRSFSPERLIEVNLQTSDGFYLIPWGDPNLSGRTLPYTGHLNLTIDTSLLPPDTYYVRFRCPDGCGIPPVIEQALEFTVETPHPREVTAVRTEEPGGRSVISVDARGLEAQAGEEISILIASFRSHTMPRYPIMPQGGFVIYSETPASVRWDGTVYQRISVDDSLSWQEHVIYIVEGGLTLARGRVELQR